MRLLSAITTILIKDIRLEFRRKVEAGSILVFAVAAGALTAFILSAPILASPANTVTVGILLTMIFLSSFASLSGFVREGEQGTLDGLRVAPLAAEALYLAKLLYSFIIILVESLVYLASTAFFSSRFDIISLPVITLVLSSTLFFAAVSSFVSALIVYTEARGILLPIVIIVLVLPYINLAVPAFIGSFLEVEIGSYIGMLAAGVGFSVVGIGLSRFMFEAL